MVVDNTTQGAPKSPALTKTKASLSESRGVISHTCSLTSPSPYHVHEGHHDRQRQSEQKEGEIGRNEPSCLHFGFNS